MNTSACWFEIPTTDLIRAKTFYEFIFQMEMREMNVDDDRMYIFPVGEGMLSVALFQADGFNPSKDGVRLYFDGDPDLSTFLGRVESAEGKVLKPKTVITKKIGYCADFMDTEGNIVSLHSRG